MAQFNFFRREVSCKIVYYGPGLSGKTTNVEIVHQKAPASNRGDLTSIVTEQDRTLFFDFMPMDLGTIAGMNVKLRLFTVPGQVYYASTRKIVLQEVDGVIFVADSTQGKLKENLESWADLEGNLWEKGLAMRDIPIVIQWNKRDLPNIMSIKELENNINTLKFPSFEGIAVAGQGVFPALKKCVAMVLEIVAEAAKKNSKQPTPVPAPAKGKPPMFIRRSFKKDPPPPAKPEPVNQKENIAPTSASEPQETSVAPAKSKIVTKFTKKGKYNFEKTSAYMPIPEDSLPATIEEEVEKPSVENEETAVENEETAVENEETAVENEETADDYIPLPKEEYISTATKEGEQKS